jgi:hypothetical protein
MRFFILLFLLFATLGFAKDGGGGLGERKPPAPLDPSRTVSEQDCSKPIDPQAGNLRCK